VLNNTTYLPTLLPLDNKHGALPSSAPDAAVEAVIEAARCIVRTVLFYCVQSAATLLLPLYTARNLLVRLHPESSATVVRFDLLAARAFATYALSCNSGDSAERIWRVVLTLLEGQAGRGHQDSSFKTLMWCLRCMHSLADRRAIREQLPLSPEVERTCLSCLGSAYRVRSCSCRCIRSASVVARWQLKPLPHDLSSCGTRCRPS
jgi:hypothetical protein